MSSLVSGVPEELASIALTGQVAVRSILGVLALAKKYGVASTDEA